MDAKDVWIYHERQHALLCGQHALNNLAQANVFSPGRLSEIAHRLDRMEMEVWAQNNTGGVNSKDFQKRLAEGSSNVDAQGNFSIEVLKSAIQSEYGISLPHLSEQDLLSGKDITDMQGFLCHKSDHWFAIRLIGGRYWNLNSTLEAPQVVGHFQLATEMENCQNLGYTIFCVPSGLPSGGIRTSKSPYWHRMEDLLEGRTTNDASKTRAWENVGSGMRLDGGRTNTAQIEELDDEMQLQMAILSSMEPTALTRKVSDVQSIAVPPEPAAGTPGTIRIQFRLPDGKRLVRRFAESDKVEVVFAFVEQQCANQPVELKSGYPPKDLSCSQIQSVKEAKLNGESIQARIK